MITEKQIDEFWGNVEKGMMIFWFTLTLPILLLVFPFWLVGKLFKIIVPEKWQ